MRLSYFLTTSRNVMIAADQANSNSNYENIRSAKMSQE